MHIDDLILVSVDDHFFEQGMFDGHSPGSETVSVMSLASSPPPAD